MIDRRRVLRALGVVPFLSAIPAVARARGVPTAANPHNTTLAYFDIEGTVQDALSTLALTETRMRYASVARICLAPASRAAYTTLDSRDLEMGPLQYQLNREGVGYRHGQVNISHEVNLLATDAHIVALRSMVTLEERLFRRLLGEPV